MDLKTLLPTIFAILAFVLYQAYFLIFVETTDFSIPRTIGAALITSIGYGVGKAIQNKFGKDK